MAILRTKLTPPRLRQSLVVRSNLLDRLNASLDGDVTLVTAPAGYGKTTLIAEWVEQAPLPVAWLTLDEPDNDINAFLTYFISAIRTLYSEACPTIMSLVQAAQPIQSDLLTTVLVNEIDDLPQRFALVLDDYHFISQPSIHELINNILRRPPIQLHLIISSRAEPPLALNRLRATGMLSELGVRELRFTSSESEAFISRLPGSLNEQAASVLLKRAEGWVTGLHLASLTLHAAADPATMIKFMAAETDRYVIEYLFEQVISQQSPEVREFLAKTAILDRVSPALARTVVGPGAAMPTTLAEVERVGLFLSALDNKGEWFVYHALFRQTLLRLLHETCSEAEIATLHQRAAEWFFQQNLVEEALGHALIASDKQLAIRIVETRVTEYLDIEGWPTLERWLNHLPDAIIAQRPLLLLAKAYVLTYRMQWDAILPYIDRAEALLAATAGAGSDEEVLARSLLSWMWAYHWLRELEPDKTRAAAERALATLPDGYPQMAITIRLILTVALQWMGEFHTAKRMVDFELASILPNPTNPHVVLRSLFTLTTLYLAEGFLLQAEQTGQMLLKKSIQASAPIVKAWSCLALGAAAYYSNDLAAAIPYFSEGVQLRYQGNTLASSQCLVGLALAYQGLGKTDEARGVMTIMGDFHRELANPLLNVQYWSLQARIALMNEDVSTARQWNSTAAPTAGLALGWLSEPATTNIRIRLADQTSQPDLVKIVADIDDLLAQLTRLRQPTRLVELLSLKAATLDMIDDRPAALQVLEEAIALAEPRGIIRPILEAGPQLESLLEEIATRMPSSYISRLLSAMRSGAITEGRQPQAMQAIPRLTPREREVLVLLSNYCTDRVIAETLVVSPLTVRTHIENLAEKLGVRGRRTIVDRARELALLP
jgi:LuxR family transcriptional regulator, maltose regulon positive regulatory protein